jgi:3-hydroxyacyl-CoA dehydrogenase / enoyl-CoA hydratase / 3-hydroxybutyryl-CoA epimerase
MHTPAGNGNRSALRLEIERGVARVEIDLPGEKVNKLTSPFMAEFETVVDGLARDATVRAVVLLSGKPDTFIAGADIGEIESLTSLDQAREKSAFGQRVFEKIERLGKPVVAAIHGACLGGGCELVLACHHRIATDDPATRIGLPEVKLGIIPGFGGTQRLPRIVGVGAALDLILSGKLLDARGALRVGLVDALVYPALRVEAAVAAAERLAASGKFRYERPVRAGWMTVPGLLERTAAGRAVMLATAARRVRAQTHGHYPAPLAAIAAIRAGLQKHGRAWEREADLLAHMALTPESQSLMHIFRLTEKNKRLGRDLPPPADVHQIAVVGAGVMGGGIAQLAASRDIRVRLKDIRRDALLVALRTVRDRMQEAVRRRRIDAAAAANKQALVSTTLAYDGFHLADTVVEAVVEKLDVKRAVLQELELHVRPDCVLATNTSALSIARLAEGLRAPGRLVGMHFFNPVHRMPLVEVVVGPETRPEAVSTVVALARRLGKTPIVVQDAPGFLVNRILAPYMNESARLFEAGADIAAVDALLRRFGMPVGPFELLDEVGADIACEVGDTMHAGFGERMQPAALAQRLVQAGRLGRKSGAGVYLWQGGRGRPGSRKRPDPGFWRTLREQPAGTPPSPETILDRVLGLMVNEAARCLEEGVVASAEDVDLALVFGIGFPPFRGGLLRWADARGIGPLVEQLQAFAREVGPRYSPCARLLAMAAVGETFYSPLTEQSPHPGAAERQQGHAEARA